MPSREKRIYRIFFTSQDKSYEIYARKVSQGEMYGFVEVEDLLFGERSAIVVDPSEESLRKEFSHVKILHIPFNCIIRIDEVEKEGVGRILTLAGQATDSSVPPIMFPPGKTPVKD